MKTRASAYNINTNKRKYITAFDAVYLREFNYEDFLNYKFYYTDDSTKNEYEVIPKLRKKGRVAFFAFVPNIGPCPKINDEGESLAHYAAKKALLSLKQLHLFDVRTKQEYFLNIIPDCSENEKRFVFKKSYYADVYYKLDKKFQQKDMKIYPYKWYENFVIEVCVTHKVSQEKINEFRENNIPVFEVLITEKTRKIFSLDGDDMPAKEQIEKAVFNMRRMFQKRIKGILISDPSSEEYLLMDKYKKEIQAFKQKKEEAEIEYNAICSQIDIQTQKLEDLQGKADYYTSLEQTIEDLRNELDEYKKHPIRSFFKKSKLENS